MFTFHSTTTSSVDSNILITRGIVAMHSVSHQSAAVRFASLYGRYHKTKKLFILHVWNIRKENLQLEYFISFGYLRTYSSNK